MSAAGRPFRTRLQVLFGHVDGAGLVYYPTFVHYFHVAMERFFGEVAEISYARVLEEHRIGHPAVHLDVDFRRPLRYGDLFEVEVVLEKVGRTSVTWRYRVFPEDSGEPAATARIVTVNMDLDSYHKTEIPDWLREALEEYRSSVST